MMNLKLPPFSANQIHCCYSLLQCEVMDLYPFYRLLPLPFNAAIRAGRKYIPGKNAAGVR